MDSRAGGRQYCIGNSAAVLASTMHYDTLLTYTILLRYWPRQYCCSTDLRYGATRVRDGGHHDQTPPAVPLP
eukprot:3808765-Rhodomonas_salina.1